MLIIRDGMPYLGVPAMEHRGMFVPEDFIVLLGVSYAFGDPSFRQMVINFVNQNLDQLGEIIGLNVEHHDGRAN